jgi:hypothetical protein
MLTCKEITFLISQSLDRELPLLQRVMMRFHLLYCIACRRYRRQVRFLRTAMSRYATRSEKTEGESMASLSSEARQRMKDALENSTTENSS